MIVIWLLKHWDRLVTYQFLIGVGCVVGLFTAWVLTTIPESERPRLTARRPVGQSLRKLLRPGAQRSLLIAWCAGFTSVAVIIPVAILATKEGYALTDYAALVYSVMLVVGSIVAAFGNSVIADHVGPRPLVILYLAGYFLVCLFWGLAPAALAPLPVALSFFVAGFCKQGLLVGLGHYFLALVDEDDRVGTGLLVRMFSGFAAGLAGAVFGGGLLHVLGRMDLSGLDIYRWYFRIMFVGLIPLLVAMVRLPRLKEWSIRDILGLFFSPRDLRAMATLNKSDGPANVTEDLANVAKLADIASNLSEDALLGYLQSAHLSVRVRALRALARQTELGPMARDVLRQQLVEGEFTTAWVAAETLGDHGVKEAVPDLRRALDSEDVFLKGKTMQALAQLGDRDSFGRIVAEFERTYNPRLVIYGAHALGLMRDPGRIPALLRKACAAGLPAAVRDEALCAAAGLVGRSEVLYLLLKEWRTDPGQIEFALRSRLPYLEKLADWEGVVGSEPIESRVSVFRELGRTSVRRGVPPDELDALIDAAQRNDLLEKLFICWCVLESAGKPPPSGDAFFLFP